ncbi:unnamed protein product [Blepharisma stoltei]|uniref:Uncharacterized protein n=1 Tax=Blepharisma stoltei TaxID=1481888 RepID=A0AAU9JAY7_9CILI|nr:unnamed protein product [Blepharisma stoltei]
MSRRMGYRFLTPRRAEVTRRIGESAEGPFTSSESNYSAFKVGIKHAKNALSSACSSFWKYIFPPAQIGVISRDAFSSLKKIQPISEFIEDSIPQPKPLHIDTGTLPPTPGRFEISDSAFKRPIEEITPYQTKRLKKEENIAPSVVNSEKPSVVNEPFKQAVPENKIKIPPWKKMQIRVGERQIKNFPVVKSENIKPVKTEENLPVLKLENTKTEKEIAKVEEIVKKEEKSKAPEVLIIKEEFKPVPLPSIQDDKEKPSEETSPESESQKIKEPLSPTMSFGDQSQNPDTLSQTPKKLNDSSQNSFYIKENKELEKIAEEKTEDVVKTERSTPKFDKEIKDDETSKKLVENAVKFDVPIKIDPLIKNPFEDVSKEKNPFISKTIDATVKPKENEKPTEAAMVEERHEPPKFNPPPAVSNPFLSSSTLTTTHSTTDQVKPLFVFGSNPSSSTTQNNPIPNPFGQPPASSQNPFATANNPFSTSIPTAPIQFGQSMPPASSSIPNPFGSSINPPSISAPNPFASSTNPPSISMPNNPFQPTSQSSTISPIAYQVPSQPLAVSPYQSSFGNTQPPFPSTQSNFNQNFQTGNNIPNRPNFPANTNYDMDMGGSRAPEISNPFGNQPFPQNSAPIQGTFNIGALPNNNRKILRAKRP